MILAHVRHKQIWKPIIVEIADSRTLPIFVILHSDEIGNIDEGQSVHISMKLVGRPGIGISGIGCAALTQVQIVPTVPVIVEPATSCARRFDHELHWRGAVVVDKRQPQRLRHILKPGDSQQRLFRRSLFIPYGANRSQLDGFAGRCGGLRDDASRLRVAAGQCQTNDQPEDRAACGAGHHRRFLTKKWLSATTVEQHP